MKTDCEREQGIREEKGESPALSFSQLTLLSPL